MSTFLSSFRRQKTLSECSDDSNPAADSTSQVRSRSGSVGAKDKAVANNRDNLTMGSSPPTDGGNYIYDIDGKFAYSYYEKKPELYDLDGKHRYK